MSVEHEKEKCWICQRDRVIKEIGPEKLAILSTAGRNQKKVDAACAMLEQAAKKGISKENDNLTSDMVDQLACDEIIGFLKHAAAMEEEK